jgi:hypothetical protein
MPTSEWNQDINFQTIIYLLSVDANKRQFDALDLNLGIVFPISIGENTDLLKIKKDAKYRVTVKILKSRVTPELKKEWTELAKRDKASPKSVNFSLSLEQLTLFKFELISIAPI